VISFLRKRSLFPTSFYIEFLCTVLACEKIRFSSLFVAGDVSRGGTSATQRQKFHTDDVKSVRNPVRSADWSTEQLHCFNYCLPMTDKRQKATKVKCKREESLTKQSILLVFSVTPFKIDQNKNQNRSKDKVRNLGNERR